MSPLVAESAFVPPTSSNKMFNPNAIGVDATVNNVFIGAHADGVAAKRNVSPMPA